MPGARYAKSFNTLTAAFQAQAAGRTGQARVVQWLCGDDPGAKKVVAGLIEDAGFVPADLGGTAGCAVMEAPRRPGAVYGEEYRAAGAATVIAAITAGRPIPPTPSTRGKGGARPPGPARPAAHWIERNTAARDGPARGRGSRPTHTNAIRERQRCARR